MILIATIMLITILGSVSLMTLWAVILIALAWTPYKPLVYQHAPQVLAVLLFGSRAQRRQMRQIADARSPEVKARVRDWLAADEREQRKTERPKAHIVANGGGGGGSTSVTVSVSFRKLEQAEASLKRTTETLRQQNAALTQIAEMLEWIERKNR